MAYENPAAYFTMADAMASRNTRRAATSGISEIGDFLRKRKQQVSALKAKRELKQEKQTSSFWTEYQAATKDLENLENSLSGAYGDTKKGSEKQKTRRFEILAIQNQIQSQLGKIAKELSNKLSSSEGQDMTEMEIQKFVGESIGRVEKLHTSITDLMAAAQEYYNSPKDGRSGSVLSSSNPQLQMLFEKMEDDEVNLLISEDENGDWQIFPMDTKITAGEIDYTDMTYDTDGDGIVSPEEKYAAMEKWARDPNNDIYTEDGDGNLIYNYDVDIDPINATDFSRKYKAGQTGGADGGFFKKVGDQKTLQESFDTAFNKFLQTHRPSIQKVVASDDGTELEVAKKDGETPQGESATPKKQTYLNQEQLKDFLSYDDATGYKNPAAASLFNAFLQSETLEEDLAGWLQTDLDLSEDKYMGTENLQKELRKKLQEYALTKISQPLAESQKATVATQATPIK